MHKLKSNKVCYFHEHMVYKYNQVFLINIFLLNLHVYKSKRKPNSIHKFHVISGNQLLRLLEMQEKISDLKMSGIRQTIANVNLKSLCPTLARKLNYCPLMKC